jgi:TRAP-type C4-dicarboxylate transport system permease small subunit
VLTRLLWLLSWIEDALVVGLLAGMITLAGAQILLRNLFGTGLDWADPLLRTMVLWLGLLGAVVAAREDRHIRIEVLPRLLPARARRLLRVATDWFAGGVCLLLAYFGGRFVAMDYAYGVPAVGVIDAWILELIIPVAFALMAFRFLLGGFVRLRPPPVDA